MLTNCEQQDELPLKQILKIYQRVSSDVSWHEYR